MTCASDQIEAGQFVKAFLRVLSLSLLVQLAVSDSLKILFVGNSYTYFNGGLDQVPHNGVDCRLHRLNRQPQNTIVKVENTSNIYLTSMHISGMVLNEFLSKLRDQNFYIAHFCTNIFNTNSSYCFKSLSYSKHPSFLLSLTSHGIVVLKSISLTRLG